ncbi:DUF4123 domain-containing protein [Pseudomonas chlororaphis]|uniref:DUF4123 domain-containing protein n=1 Tax=Pseudomonas chlororaphis TaxID=587753 RepID=UPI0009BD015F|nr:DUF4123 domain-containing protein [Pseudomonas chlororaphis]
MAVLVKQWLTEQLRLGHSLCLILDSADERATRQALLGNHDPEQYCSVYRGTQAADLADVGPLIFVIDKPDGGYLKELLKAPERNWGWLASIHNGRLPALTQHWRDRMVIGTRPNQALYRFQDNRVLSRALGHIPKADHPEYLGPAISVCYWQGTQWAVIHNHAPGEYSVPTDPSWLNVPAPTEQTMDILQTNIYRYLWAERSNDLLRISQHQDPKTWLAEQLAQAQQWGWLAPEQLHFLILQNLSPTEPPIVKNWLPKAGETSQAHFERLFNEVKFWSGEESA